MLFGPFIVRPLLRDRVRTATTIAGIALGIAVVSAIQLTNAASVRGFETALEAVAGRTSVEIVAPGGGLDERLMVDLAWLGDIGLVSPVVQGDAAIVDGRGPGAGADDRARGRRIGEAVRVLGVDILRDQPFRDYRLISAPSASSARLLEILVHPQSIVTTEKLARRRGLAVGDTVTLLVGDRERPFTIQGLLADEGPARVLDGNFVLMDIAAAQLAFNRLGRLDRLDVRLPDPDAVHPALVEIAGRLPPGLQAQRPERRAEQVDTMLAAFHLNLTALSWIALVVGLFLVYNTVTVSVVARRQEIGTLRALGVTRRRVLALFLGEAALLGLAGVAVGLGLARLLADAAVSLTAATVSTLYIATAAAAPDLTWTDALVAVAVGLPLSLAAAAVPALEASRVPPTAAMRGPDPLAPGARWRPMMLAAPAAVLALAAWLATLEPVMGGPYFGYLSSLAVVVGAALVVPAVMILMGRALGPLLRPRVAGLLAHANWSAAIPRLSISVAALAVSLSMMVAIAVMIGSFRDTVVYWVGQTLQADLFIGPGVRPTVGSEQVVSGEVVDAVGRHPEVTAVDTFRNVDLTYRGNLVVLGAGTFTLVVDRGSLLFKSPAGAREAVRAAIGRDAVIVSEAFANRYDVADGDTLTLATPAGPRAFEVAAVYYDYASDRGVVLMDHGTFRRYWGVLPPTGVAAYLAPGADPARVREEILASLAEGYRAFVYTNRGLRDEVLRVFDSTFAITYALEVVAVVVAILGVSGTLVTLVLERRRDLSMLRLAGATRRQVRGMVVIEAALIGAASQAIGLVVGLALSTILIHVINVQSFGWTIQFHLPAAFLVQSSVVIVSTTAIAGIYPARRAAHLVLSHDE